MRRCCTVLGSEFVLRGILRVAFITLDRRGVTVFEMPGGDLN